MAHGEFMVYLELFKWKRLGESLALHNNEKYFTSSLPPNHGKHFCLLLLQLLKMFCIHFKIYVD